ncbi:K+-channel ERG and related proteins [Klebsormidium nitens]|uniref:K+-channel ERG and related proteins n=1 Tax=Klebsormidium nitens TaxID=105231 RepID=A0A1Y1HW01_KLENI|nr:K+-channel ERG and related proteins [Klebsormidium nitens]|eukprot:GAQ82343.1 K+-channel ERG and related proteins [Klebsormidium nitens]
MNASGIALWLTALRKLLRLARTGRIIQRLQTNLNVDFGVMKMFKFMASSVFISHWLACVWRLIADLESDGANWLARLGMENQSTISIYSTSLYFAVVSLTSTGYGDVTAVTVWEQYYVIFVLLLGSYYFGYIVGEITALVSSRSADENEFHMRMDQLNNFMEDHHLPPDLRTKLRDYFRYRHNNKGVGNFHSLLSMMSKNLRAEVAGHTNGVWINKLPFFRSCPTEFVIEVSLNMESETFAPQEAIIRLNEPPEKMFVVRKGVVAGNGRIHTSGSVIGTDMLFEARSTRRAHSAMALTYCDLMSLDRKVLFQILEHHPDVAENLRKASIRTLFRTEALAYMRAVKLAVASRNQEVVISKETFDGQPNGERIKFYLDKLVVLLRKDQEEMDRLKDATLKIQSVFRGHRVRKKYKGKLRKTVDSLAKSGPVLLTRLTPDSASNFKPPVPLPPASEGDFVRLEETVDRLQRQVYASSNRHQKQIEATRVSLEKQLAVSSREINSRLSNLMEIIRNG